MKRDVLLIAKQSIKAEALVRYWPTDRWNLHLYTHRKKEWFPGMSEQFGNRWTALLPAKHNGFGGNIAPGTDRRKTAKRMVSASRKKIRKYLHTRLLRFWDQKLTNWAIPSRSQLRLLAGSVNPDLVLSIYEPLAANLIARNIAVIQRIPWIAYFRDHCTTYNEMLHIPGLWHLQSAYDRRIHASLSNLVGVSPQFVSILSDFYNIPSAKSHVITGGYDDRYLPAEIRQQCNQRRQKGLLNLNDKAETASALKVNYIGNLYGHRLEPLLIFSEALQTLSRKGVAIELRLVLSNASYLFPEKVRLMVDQLKRNGIAVIFEAERIAYDQALKILDASDVNIILEGLHPPHSTAGTLTLKIFDLMMIARPSVAVCASSLPIGDYLRETGIGIACDDTQSVFNTLMDVWAWKRGGAAPAWYSPDANAIEQYSCRSMAQKISALAEEVVNASGR